MLGLNYGPDGDPLAALERPDAGAISVYARHRDYHDVLKGKLKQLAAFLDRRGAAGTGGRQGVRRHRAAAWKSRWPRAPGSAGRASTPIWSRANSARGCSWARS